VVLVLFVIRWHDRPSHHCSISRLDRREERLRQRFRELVSGEFLAVDRDGDRVAGTREFDGVSRKTRGRNYSEDNQHQRQVVQASHRSLLGFNVIRSWFQFLCRPAFLGQPQHRIGWRVAVE
jgi:hypothetical protein